jgi:hypothetical protein
MLLPLDFNSSVTSDPSVGWKMLGNDSRLRHTAHRSLVPVVSAGHVALFVVSAAPCEACGVLGRAVLTGDFSVAPLAVVATLLGAACSNAVYLVTPPPCRLHYCVSRASTPLHLLCASVACAHRQQQRVRLLYPSGVGEAKRVYPRQGRP